MIVASINTATAKPSPICLMSISRTVAKSANTPTITSAALVTVPAVRVIACSIAKACSASRLPLTPREPEVIADEGERRQRLVNVAELPLLPRNALLVWSRCCLGPSPLEATGRHQHVGECVLVSTQP